MIGRVRQGHTLAFNAVRKSYHELLTSFTGPKAPGEEGRSEAEKEIMNEIILAPAAELQPAPLFTPTPKAAQRGLEFFTAQINDARRPPRLYAG